LGRERPDEVGIRVGHPRGESLFTDLEGVEPIGGKVVLRAGGHGSGLEANGIEAVDGRARLVEHRDVALAEQLGDDLRTLVLALEGKGEYAVEAVLGNTSKIRPREAISEHLREVGRAFGGVGDVFGRGDVCPLELAGLHEEFDPTAIEVPQFEPDERVGIEIGLVDLRADEAVEFCHQRREIDAGKLAFPIHIGFQGSTRKRRVDRSGPRRYGFSFPTTSRDRRDTLR
jgi:hypothetical protein